MTLAPNEVHPYHSRERSYLPSWRFYRNKIAIPCLGPCRLNLVVSHPRTPILNCFTHLMWAYVLIDSQFSSMAMLTKPYLVSGPIYLPQIPDQLHGMLKGAHEVLGTIFEAKLMSVFLMYSFLCSYVTEALYCSLYCLCTARLCYTCFDLEGFVLTSF